MSKTMTTLVTYEWNFKKFTSQDRLNSLWLSKQVSRSLVPKIENGYEFGAWYTYSTLDGVKIATFYKDHHFGFGTQATGVELHAVTSL